LFLFAPLAKRNPQKRGLKVIYRKCPNFFRNILAKRNPQKRGLKAKCK